MEGIAMVRSVAKIGLMIALTAGWGSLAAAQETKDRQGQQQQHGMMHARLETLTAKLNLNKQQQEAIQKIFTEFDEKTGRLDRQLWTLHDQECTSLIKILTDDQRNKLPAVLKQEREQELNKIAMRLGLTDDEKQRIRAVCEKFEPQFEQLIHQKADTNVNRVHELRHEVLTAVQNALGDEHRGKLPGILREEFQQWHDPAMRSQHLNEIADKLSLNDNQREQARGIIAEFDKQRKEPVAQLHQMQTEERAAVEKLLNDEQRNKLRELLKGGGR